MVKAVIIALFATAASFGAMAEGVRLSVQSGVAGEIRLSCEKAGGWTFAMEPASDGERDIVTVRMESAVESRPPAFALDFEVSGAGVQHVWSYDWMRDAYHLWPASWAARSTDVSQLACGIPVSVAFGGDDNARFAMACSEPFEKVRFALGAQESRAQLCGRFEFFTENSSPRKAYEVRILLDSRKRFWADAVADAASWVAKEACTEPASVPDAAYDPLYSTWYAYWQDVNAAPLEREAKKAAELGMKTMILDDGWQKVASRTAYSATGDWNPVPNRFPDMAKHVEAVHKAGLKYMLWFSVPYVGDESEAWNRFQGKFLKKHPDGVGVLDPRFPEVREHLIRLYERAVRDWGFDGLKLDFIDEFVLGEVDPAVAQNYAGRDFRSLPEAVDRLMKDVLSRLKAIRPDVLIEFRQNYMGPAIRQYGNMIRALDCPADPVSNRKRIVDLRLTSGSTPVHSDMIVWSRDETVEGAALPILNALFGVIQYSIRLADAKDEHLEAIRHWLQFSQRHRDVLLKGRFLPHHPESAYPLIEAENGDERIAVCYLRDYLVRVAPGFKVQYLINATAEVGLAAELTEDVAVELYDARGCACGQERLASGMRRIAIPSAGYAVFRRLSE